MDTEIDQNKQTIDNLKNQLQNCENLRDAYNDYYNTCFKGLCNEQHKTIHLQTDVETLTSNVDRLQRQNYECTLRLNDEREKHKEEIDDYNKNIKFRQDEYDVKYTAHSNDLNQSEQTNTKQQTEIDN